MRYRGNIEVLKDLKIKNWRDIDAKIVEYSQKYKYPTFRGLLNYIGIGSEEMEEIMIGRYSEKDNPTLTPKYSRIYKRLELYKNELEVKLEEYMLYQSKHEDLKDMEFVNYKNFEFLLKSSNRSVYDSASSSKSSSGAIGVSKKEENKLPLNTSGVRLWTK